MRVLLANQNWGKELINALLLEYRLCTKSVQYSPKMLINGVLIPCVEMGE